MVQEIGDNCWKKTWLKRVDFAGKSFRHASVFSTYHWRLKYTEVQSQQRQFLRKLYLKRKDLVDKVTQFFLAQTF